MHMNEIATPHELIHTNFLKLLMRQRGSESNRAAYEKTAQPNQFISQNKLNSE